MPLRLLPTTCLCAALSLLALAGCSRTLPDLDVSGMGPIAGQAGGHAGGTGGGASGGGAGRPGPACDDDDWCDDAVDNDCDGAIDEGCGCPAGAMRACYSGPPGTESVGTCHGGATTCDANGNWSTCVGEVTPTIEICDNDIDENCDGASPRACGTLGCPGQITTLAGMPVTLAVMSTNAGSFEWKIISAPPGGDTTALWASMFPQSSTETVTLPIVGEYLFSVTTVDTTGELLECTFPVRALPHGLRVQLYWDGTGDVDLHLHDDANVPWFVAPNDCYYGNEQPSWGAALDVDNTMGYGPENIRLDDPVIGETYTVAVHNYANAVGRRATVEIFCGEADVTAPVDTFVSRPFTGGAATGQCTENEFWRVATVQITSAGECSVTPIDSYGSSSAACSSFTPPPPPSGGP